MTDTRTTKRALLFSVIAMVLCFTMLLGTTFAWFTDSVTSSTNVIKSGNLDVTMDWLAGTDDPTASNAAWIDASTGAIFDYDLWEPGYVEARHIKISNVGNLALKYRVYIIANGAVSELADVIDVYYVDPSVQLDNRTDLDSAMVKLGTLRDIIDNLGSDASTAAGNLAAGESHTITLALKMQETAGNKYEDISIGTDFSVILMATQENAEIDSFDENYDDIEVPAPETTTP